MGPCNPTLSIDFDQVGNEVHVDMIVEIFLSSYYCNLDVLDFWR